MIYSNICSIYKITNLINGKLYIGQTWFSILYRFKCHCYDSSKCVKLIRGIKKYGKEKFKIELITIANTQEVADYWETYFIDFYKTVKNGYNLKEGGSTGKHSEETKVKMRKPKSEDAKINMRGRLKSEETKFKMRKPKSEKAKANMKKPKSEEAKLNMKKAQIKRSKELTPEKRAYMRGRVISEETRAKMRKPKSEAAKINMKQTEQQKLLISKSNIGKPKSEEHKKNISLAKKGKKILNTSKMNRSKLTYKVAEQIRFDFSQNTLTYDCLAKKYNVAISTIGKIVTFKTHKNIK